MKENWEGKQVLVIGAARQGLATARFLCLRGATVILNDRRKSDELHISSEWLKNLKIRWVVGSHPIDLLDQTDYVCLSGGIPLDLPIIIEAKKRMIPLINDTEIFMREVPCQTIGITGSAGKTTTTSLVGKIAQTAFEGSTKKVWVGGNIGDPLLNYVDEMHPDDFAVLEISSFQLDQMTRSSDIAAVLNITPNHLDRHKTMEKYIAAKSRLLDFQTSENTAILGRDDPGSWSLRGKVKGKLLSFGFSILAPGSNGIQFIDGKYTLKMDSEEKVLCTQDDVQLRGSHNQLNVMASCLIASTAGITEKAIQAGVRGFSGVAHRLEFVRTWGGADWYNDSIATAPERTMAAIHAFDRPIVILLGGRDKDLPWDSLTGLIQDRVSQVVLFGEATNLIELALDQIPESNRHFSVSRCKGLQEAILSASRLVKPGDVVLLSPGGTSFDEFCDFEERGERFRKWVQELS